MTNTPISDSLTPVETIRRDIVMILANLEHDHAETYQKLALYVQASQSEAIAKYQEAISEINDEQEHF